jgi:hypothetical protein
MGLAEADSSVQIERVVRLGGLIDDCQGGGVGELITRADYEAGESVFLIQPWSGIRDLVRGGLVVQAIR